MKRRDDGGPIWISSWMWVTPEIFMTEEELRQAEEEAVEPKPKDPKDILRSIEEENADPLDLSYNHLRTKLISLISSLSHGISRSDMMTILTYLIRMIISSSSDYKAEIAKMRESLKLIISVIDQMVKEEGDE